MKTKNLTPTQKRVLDWIRTQEIAPSLLEIAMHFGVTISSAQYFVRTLVAKGWIKKDPHVARGIYLAN